MLSRKLGFVPAMTRKRLGFIADTINTAPLDVEQKEVLAVWFADNLEASGEAFDRDKFVERCTKE